MTYLVIASGGALGAVARYGLSGIVQSWTAGSFPLGTMAVNILGSFGLGFALVYLDARMVSAELRGFVTIGLFGAFTTFSTFSYESLELLQDRAWARATAYVGGSVVVGLVAVALGFWAASWSVTPRG